MNNSQEKTINLFFENGDLAVRLILTPELINSVIGKYSSFVQVDKTVNPIEEVSVFKSESEIDNNPIDLKKYEFTDENVMGELKEKEIVLDDLEIQVTNFLKELGMPAHIKGYNFSRIAIIMGIDNPQILSVVTSELYPSIAEKFNSTSSRVERAIRHAIEVAWNRGNKEFQTKYFKYASISKSGRPTNTEFVAVIVEHFRLKNKVK